MGDHHSTLATPFAGRATADEVLAGVDLTGRSVLVTGGGSGLGLETARALARAGADVTAAVRRPGRSTEAVDGVRQLPLDLADLASVQRLADEWDRRLDVLVANAGIMAIPTRQVTPQGWELQLATNYLGHFALALGLRRALADAAADRGEARLVVVSSGAHRTAPLDVDDPQFEHRPYGRWAAYGQSKTADVLFVVEAARKWAAEGISANALNPGFINTGLQRHVDDDTMRALGAMDEDGNLVEADYYKTPAQGASTSALLAGSPLVAGVTGRYFEDNQEAAVVAEGDHGVAPHALDEATAAWLWQYASRSLR
ncbi:SDR family NAD(P)-dependent oxidoreductase [Nocardioides sp. LMS-CY]|uniref:SDR family NAD(P)-dependent oxidoreductase n=1 Tax=Nocardioides sp. (strain LMS-CY) TaxID=2840457 RepID=UPI001BFFF1DE|nr:SDR family NAD(P)-dependent oxidoreductase [Nocardioides sp. LMS-CY]QWF20446.1 SDR family NAD(P)-dependent oxidoreductase [Nocardioides sp. LMS-CY]